MTGLGGTRIRQTEPLRGQHPRLAGAVKDESEGRQPSFSVVTLSRLAAEELEARTK